MPTRIAKWFSRTKGYGFIKPDKGKENIFVHINALIRANIDEQRVSYEVENLRGRMIANNLQAAALIFQVYLTKML